MPFFQSTEAHDDEGLPHTLEHLVFLGSELYPYKGVLDLLANRCLASGTNAWTDIDHTCYTVTTAGSEGFLNLLPIYLDHILYPVLTESGYITEVHHINGDGEDAGVVYCEMQARENTGESRTHIAMLKNIYPPDSGYSFDTGGVMKKIRTSLTHKKVCDYHHTFYRPENLCVIVTGQVDAFALFQALKPIEERIEMKGDQGDFERPWQTPVSPLDSYVEKTVKYPTDDEDQGLVLVAWRGPLAQELYLVSAMMVLMEYFTDTVVAPLKQEFVEIDDPYSGNVHYTIVENYETCICLEFENTDYEKLDSVTTLLHRVLERFVDGSTSIDMTRMQSVIHRRILDCLNHLESNPHDSVAFTCIGHFLYGNTEEDLNRRLNQVQEFRKMKSEPEDFWINLIEKYFVAANHVAIIGEPSIQLMDAMAEEEKARISQQKKELGEAGLKAMADKVHESTVNNEVPPPGELISSLSVPGIASIQFHPIVTTTNRDPDLANANERFPLADLPFTFQLDDMHTNFVEIDVLLNTSELPLDLKPYLCVLVEVICESPIRRNGEVIPYQDVVAQLGDDTLDFDTEIGIGGKRFKCGHVSELIAVTLKVEHEKYKKGVKWARALLYDVIFTAERIRIIAGKMVSDVSRMKRSGQKICQSAVKDLNFCKESNRYISGMMRQHKFLSLMLEELELNEKKIVGKFEKLISHITQPENVTVHMTANVARLADVHPDPVSIWKNEFLPDNIKCTIRKLSPVKKCSDLLNSPDEGLATGVIIGVGALESAFLSQTVKCITSHRHPDLPAIMVFIQYLTQLEGPMWRQIRGHGLSYHYTIKVRPPVGLLQFMLCKSSHIVSAYKRAKAIVDDHISGKAGWDPVQLESCKSSLLFELIDEEKTVTLASEQSLLAFYFDTDKKFKREFMDSITKVTEADLTRIGNEHMAALFDPGKSKCAVCVNPTRIDEIQQGFQRLGRELKVYKSIDKSFLSEF